MGCVDAYYFAFDSTHCAMAASKALGDKALIIATPREITADCGMTLKIESVDEAQARALHTDLIAQGVQTKLFIRNENHGFIPVEIES